MEIFVHRQPKGFLVGDLKSIEELGELLTHYGPLLDDTEVTVEITASWAEVKSLLLPSKPHVPEDIWLLSEWPIARWVAREYEVTVAEILGRSRQSALVEARQVVMYLFRQHLNLTLTEVGTWLGGRSPATISYGHDKIVDQMQRSTALKETIARFEARGKNSEAV